MIRYVLLVVTALVATVVGLELALQAGALVVGAGGRDPMTDWVGGGTRVLALGDSNTYGLFLPAEQSYPAQFEALWNAEIASPKVEVINLGYPGTNSSVLLNNLPKLLATFRPDVVLIMVGVNDFWTDTVPREETAQGVLDGARTWLRQHSRAYKLAYMIRRSFYDPADLDLGERTTLESDAIDAKVIDAISEGLAKLDTTSLSEVRYGDQKFALGYVTGKGTHGNVPILKENLRTILEEIDRDGSQPVLLTYPADLDRYQLANRVTRTVARQTGVPLVDIARALAEHCPDSPSCPELFFPDQHAKQPGYAIAARRLMRDLHAAGLLRGRR